VDVRDLEGGNPSGVAEKGIKPTINFIYYQPVFFLSNLRGLLPHIP
jgi:hypothetical protein